MNSWEKFNKENEMYAVGQQADLHTKKKGSSKKSKEGNTPLRNQIHALQEQNAAAMIREIEYKKILKECHAAFEHIENGVLPQAWDLWAGALRDSIEAVL